MADAECKVIIRKKDRIAYILGGICDYYDIPPSQLTNRTRRPDKLNRRKIAMKILYEVADCSLKDIANALDYKPLSLPSVYQHIANFNDDISKNTIGNKELKLEYKNVLNYLKL